MSLAPTAAALTQPATLLFHFLAITAPWRSVFPQARTWRRAVRQALGSLVCLGRRCVSRIIWTNGGQHRSWSAEYFLHSRCQWNPHELFQPILRGALAYCPGRLVGVAVDAFTYASVTRVSARPAVASRRPSIPATHSRLRSMSISSAPCAFYSAPCWCRSTSAPR